LAGVRKGLGFSNNQQPINHPSNHQPLNPPSFDPTRLTGSADLKKQNRGLAGTIPASNLRPGEHTIACIRPAQVEVKSIRECPAPADAPQEWFRTKVQYSANYMNGISCLLGREVLADDMLLTQQGPKTAGDLESWTGDQLAEAFPVRVQKPMDVAPSQRVKLSVWQGDRHSVLVKTPASTESPMDWAAVGSGNASIGFSSLHCKLDTLSRTQRGPQSLRRCHSDPAIFPRASDHGASCDSANSILSTMSSGTGTDERSDESSTIIKMPVKGDLALSDHKRLRTAGESQGSQEHPASCQPCKWYFQHASFREDLAHGRPRPPSCHFGTTCGFCHHEDHMREVDSIFRKQRGRQGRGRVERRQEALL